MKKHLNYWLALILLLPAITACHEDETIAGEEPGEAGNPTVVHATIATDNPGTRAQVQWGNPNPDAGELFMWNNDDHFNVYKYGSTNNIDDKFRFNIQNYDEAQPGKEADFKCDNFTADAGTKITAFYTNMLPENLQWGTVDGKTYLQAIISIVANVYQNQQDNPGDADLKHLSTSLMMYATGEADNNGGILPLSFRHLLALFRFTITNRQANAAQIKSITLSFPNQSVLCTKKTVTIWEDCTMTSTVEEANKRTEKTLNLKKGLEAQYATIASGSSYDCFLPAMPAAEENNKATGATITVTFEGGTTQSVSIDGFSDVEIKAGMRYWFDLTITEDGTLVQTSRLPKPYGWYTSDKDASTFTLSTVAELREFANLVNGTDEAKNATGATGPVTFKDKTVQIADGVTTLDLNNEEWTPISIYIPEDKNFSGTFDGRGVTIKNMKVSTPVMTDDYDYALGGFFGRVNPYGTIKNLIVEGTVEITASDKYIFAGGICGSMTLGKIEFCRFSGTVSSTLQSTNKLPYNYAGGIAGEYPDLLCCISDATVTQTTALSNTTYTGAGGLLGRSVASGSVTYSAWNSSKTTAMIGETKSIITTGTESFTDINGLNGLLQAMNAGSTDSEFMWQADPDGGSPVLVKRASPTN